MRRPRLRSCATAALALVTVCFATNTGAQPLQFAPPRSLNSNAATDTATETFDDLATDGAGTWIAVWGSNEPFQMAFLEGDIQFVRSTDGGVTWTAPAPIDPNPTLDDRFDGAPAIAADGAGNWIAVWQSISIVGTTASDSDLLVARSSDGGATWSAPVPLDASAATDAYDDNLPRITTDRAGTWIAAWHGRLGGAAGIDLEILTSRSTDAGATWSAPVALDSDAVGDARSDVYARLATDGSTWVAVWQGEGASTSPFGGDTDILTARSVDGGVTWSAPAPVNGNATTDVDYDLYPHVSTDGAGTWVAVWTLLPFQEDPEIPIDSDVKVARSTDGGATWSAPTFLNGNAGIDQASDDVAYVATDGSGTWIAAWTSFDSLGGTLPMSYGNILQARSTDGGATWTAPFPLNADAFDAACELREYGDVRVVGDGSGTWVATWTGSTRGCPDLPGTDGDVFVARASTACGDAIVDAGEQCDDGGVTADDGCSPACQFEPCAPAPAPACSDAPAKKASLKIKVSADPAKNRVDWKWRGDEVGGTRFGNPARADHYYLCVYDAGSLVSTTRIAAGGTCGRNPCWKGGIPGWVFKDKSLASDGALQLVLKPGVDGRAQLRFAGRGPDLQMPALPASGPVVVQLKRAHASLCWEATFGGPFIKNVSNGFLGRN